MSKAESTEPSQPNTDSGYGVVVRDDDDPSAKAALRIVPQATEPIGPNLVGDIYVTKRGVLKICTVAGTPGTWASVGHDA